jgi:AraC-like DNA-binding protein
LNLSLLDSPPKALVEHNRKPQPTLSKDEFELLCQCVVTGETLKDAIERAQRFLSIINNQSGQLCIHVDESQMIVSLKNQPFQHVTEENQTAPNGLGLYYQLFSWLIGKPIALDTGDTVTKQWIPARSRPSPRWFKTLSEDIRPSKKSSSLVFSTHYLQSFIVRNHSEIGHFMDNFPFDNHRSYPVEKSLVDQVHTLIGDAVGYRGLVPSCEDIAHKLHMSIRTLRRRLSEYGTSYRQIREQCLSKAAIHLLESSDLSIENIAEKLGFSGESNFRRAFKQWTGSGTWAYRQAIKNTPVSSGV